MHTIKRLLRNKWTYIFLFFYLYLLVIMPRHGFWGDEQYWRNWAYTIRENGLLNAYRDQSINYLPPFLYILAPITELLPDLGPQGGLMYVIKGVTLLFDLGQAVLVYLILKKLKLPGYRIVFLLLNLAWFYLTFIWGQIDSIPVFFVLASLWAALNKRPYWSVALYTIGASFKLQMILFAPLLGIILLSWVLKTTEKRKNALKLIGTAVAVELALLAPFIVSGHLEDIFSVFTEAVGFYPYISFNAYNLWFLLEGQQGIFTEDSRIFFGPLTYYQAGTLLYVTALALALIPVLWLFYRTYRSGKWEWLKRPHVALSFLSAGLSAYVFFFFNTQMHERYLYPALVFLALHALITYKPWAYILAALGFLLNVESIMRWLPIDLPLVSAVLILAGLLVSYYYLYSEFLLLRKREPAKKPDLKQEPGEKLILKRF